MTNIPTRLARPLASLLLLALVALAYLPGMGGDFIFDDFANIVANKKVHAETLDWDSLARAAGSYQGPIGRPLATVGFAIDHAIGGKSPLPFKIHSLIVHLANALLVLLLCRRLLALDPRRAWPAWVPWLVALVWAAHPLQVSTVLYIVQRMEMLAALFVIAGLLLYLEGRKRQEQGLPGWHWLAASAVVAGIGLLAKESAALFPLFALAIELTLLRFRATKPQTTRLLKGLYLAVLAVGIAIFIGVVMPRYGAADAFGNRDFTLIERLLSQLRILPMYLGQILAPVPASMPFYYDNYPASTGLLSPPSTLAGGLLLAALLALALACRRKVPLLSMGLLWFFAAHALTSGPVNLELAFEHRNYLASLGVLLAAAAAIAATPTAPSREATLTAMTVLGMAILSLCAIRTATWGHPLVLAMDMAGRNPGSSRASSDLGAIYARMAGQDADSPYIDLALAEFERGAALPGASPLPEQGLILLAAANGRPIDPAWWRSLYQKLETNPIGPQEVMAVTGLLNERMSGIEIDDQALGQAYRTLARRGGGSAEAYLAFAHHADRQLADPELAEALYVAAMASESMTPEYAQRVLFALATEGKQRYVEAAGKEALRRGLVEGE